MKTKLLIYIILPLMLSSCIKSDPLWQEADIEGISLPDDIMANYVISTDNKVTILLHPEANYKELTPEIRLSEGATISPASGTAQDFTNDVVYTVTSQNGATTQEYIFSVTSNMSLKYNFDDWDMFKTTVRQYEKYADSYWDNANEGAGIIAQSPKDHTTYPTQSTDDAISGRAAFLQTIKGKQLIFPRILIPLAAGNLFMGKFKLGTDYNAAITFAKFGQIHPKQSGKPVRFTGYYKYKSGETYQYFDKPTNKVTYDTSGKKDECAIYAILFKVSNGEEGIEEYLDGTTVATSDRIVAKASIAHGNETENFDEQFTYFDCPFLNVKTNKPDYELDYENNNYKIAIVMSSSERGDYYEGSVGSTLIVDDLEIVTSLIKE